MDFTVTEQGRLSGPRLHDADILGLELKGSTLRVHVRDVAERMFTVHLIGLKQLVSDDFRERNIISRVLIFCSIKPEISDVRRLFRDLHSSVGLPHQEQREQAIEDSAREVAEGRLTLVVVEPSYGCELYALCEKVRIEQG